MSKAIAKLFKKNKLHQLNVLSSVLELVASVYPRAIICSISKSDGGYFRVIYRGTEYVNEYYICYIGIDGESIIPNNDTKYTEVKYIPHWKKIYERCDDTPVSNVLTQFRERMQVKKNISTDGLDMDLDHFDLESLDTIFDNSHSVKSETRVALKSESKVALKSESKVALTTETKVALTTEPVFDNSDIKEFLTDGNSSLDGSRDCNAELDDLLEDIKSDDLSGNL